MIAIIATKPDDLIYLKARLTFVSGEHTLQPGFITTHGFFGSEEVVLLSSGESNYMSAMLANAIIARYNPDLIYGIGDCFALSPLVKEGDVIIGSACYLHGVNFHAEGQTYGSIPGQPECYPCSSSLSANALALAGQSGIRAYGGAIMSGEKLIFKKDEFEEIMARRYAGKNIYGYDTSSAGIALACYLHKKPFLPLRVVSFVPGIEASRLSYKRTALEAMPNVGRIIFGLCSAHQSKKGGAR